MIAVINSTETTVGIISRRQRVRKKEGERRKERKKERKRGEEMIN